VANEQEKALMVTFFKKRIVFKFSYNFKDPMERGAKDGDSPFIIKIEN